MPSLFSGAPLTNRGCREDRKDLLVVVWMPCGSLLMLLRTRMDRPMGGAKALTKDGARKRRKRLLAALLDRCMVVSHKLLIV